MFYVVECESSFFFLFLNDERRPRSIYSFSWLLIIVRLNAFSSLLRLSRYVSPPFLLPLLLLLILPLLPSRSAPSSSIARDSTPFLLQVSPRSLRVLFARENTLEICETIREIIRYRSRECAFVDQGGETARSTPCVSGETRGRGRLGCCFFRL